MNRITAQARLQKDPLQTPFICLVISFSFLYVRWHAILPGISVLKIPGLLSYGLILWFLIKGNKQVLRESLIRYCILILVLMAISWTYAIHVSAFYLTQYVFLIIFSFVIPLICTLNNWERISKFFYYWVLIQFGVALWAIKTKGVGSGDFLSDENDLALAMSMAIPYPFYLSQTSFVTQKTKYLCTAALLAIITSIIVSFSRGGFVGLSSVGFMLWLMSKRKLRNLSIAVVATVLLGGLAINLLPQGYIDRLNTMSDPNNSTRVERLNSWEIGRIMWKYNPIFGVGVGQYPWNVEHYERLTSYWIDDVRTKSLAGRQAHSLYFTLLPELGLVGVTVYSLFVFSIAKTLRRIIKAGDSNNKKTYRRNFSAAPGVNQEHLSDTVLLAKAVACSMVGYFVSGTFISVLYYPHLWIIAGFAIVLKNQAFPTAISNQRATTVNHPQLAASP